MHSYPMRFKPLLKVRVWGGTDLSKRYGKEDGDPIGESWEVCDHDEDVSIIANGPHAGQTLHELLQEDKAALAGNACNPHQPDKLPLMLKLLDSQGVLSVQVHPDDEYANRQKPGELGKTEAWYILEADEGACIYRGLNPGVTAEELKKAMDEGTVDRCLKRIEVRPGDCFFIPSGTIHALGAGVRMAEIQQNSDTTYRLFDWNRMGLDGKPRDLHQEDSLAVSKFADSGPDHARPEPLVQAGCQRQRFIKCEQFALERLGNFEDTVTLDTAGESFHILTTIDGSCTVSAGGVEENLQRWDTTFIPAGVGEYSISADQGTSLLLFYVPQGK